MDTNLEFKLTLEPVGYDNVWPEFYIKIDNVLQDKGILTEQLTYNFDVTLTDGLHNVAVGLVNKVDLDTCVVDNKIVADKAIIVHPIEIEGYKLDNFMHRAVYYPIGREQLNSNYLGWNGHWQLEFATPIFSWIHETQHLGWVYGKNI
jgi:hypothetical protein